MIKVGIAVINMATILFDNFDEDEEDDLWRIAKRTLTCLSRDDQECFAIDRTC